MSVRKRNRVIADAKETKYLVFISVKRSKIPQNPVLDGD